MKDVKEPERDKSDVSSDKKGALKYTKLYSFATPLDWLLMFLGFVGAFINGLAFPAFTIVFADLVNTFGEATPGDDFSSKLNTISLQFVGIASISLVSSYLEVAMFMLSGVRQAGRIRQAYLTASLRQDVTYYDIKGTTGDVLTGLNNDSELVQAGISEKVGNFIHHVVTFVVAIGIALYRGWELALVMLALTPLLGIAGASMAKVMTSGQEVLSNAYAEANTMSSQAISNIRTIASFGSEEEACGTYGRLLKKSVKVSTMQSLYQGMAGGAVNAIVFCTYSIAFWYGAKLVRERSDYNGGDVMNVIFGAIVGGFSLGQAAPNLQHFTAGTVAGRRMFDVIERVPPIDIDAPGIIPTSDLKGHISIENVKFSYPARPEVTVFDNFSLDIKPGQQVALVGASGSGKSTVIQLLERFYDPHSGRIMVDGMDLKSISLSWYRSQVGLVSQEPTLFATTIRANIMMGRTSATDEECIAAAKAANAHSFVSALPNGYDTQVGERGVQLSGGQKQRIAISRALLKNPRILLLDEATSALDTKSERAVQAALDTLATGRTTIVVAHRLSTIINASKIAVVQAGAVVETGTHSELYAQEDGVYHALVKLQQQAHVVTDAKDDSDDDVEAIPAGGKAASMRVTSDKNFSKAGLEGVTAISTVDEKDKKEDKLTDEEKQKKVSMWRLLKYNKPEWPFLFFGVISSSLIGSAMPIFAILLGSLISLFFDEDVAQAKKDSELYALLFLFLGIGMFCFSAIQAYSFGRMGSSLAQRVRLLLFHSLLYQEVGWFDKDENSSGAVASRLSTDAAAVRGATGDTLGLLFQNIVTMVVGYTIAFINGWRMTLVVTAILPLLGFSSYMQMAFYAGNVSVGGEFFNKANQTASEGIAAIRTVHSYALHESVSGIYKNLLTKPTKDSKKNAHVSGLALGFSQFVQFAVYALAFWFGGQELEKDRMTFDNILKVFFSILLASMGAAQAQLAFPDVAKGKFAVARVFTVIDRKSEIDASDPSGTTPTEAIGDVELKNVTFSYPTRPDVPIFRNFSLRIPPGKVTALVGESGSGKSTIINLVERFYNVDSGMVLLDGHDVKTLSVRWLRSTVGLVSQEPMLFNATILDNLKYGKPSASMDEVIAAATVANAMEFINRQPDKFGTLLGEGGGISLSGGQKQRIAIARAVLKDPRVLLLDEATSALDAESERVVQEALDRVMAGRTSIVIAHRLTTVRNADKIAVVQRGVVLEQGSHNELMAKGTHGAYVQLQNAQAT